MGGFTRLKATPVIVAVRTAIRLDITKSTDMAVRHIDILEGVLTNNG